MAELKLCPFCDGEAEMRNPWTSSANYYVECYECGCTTAIFDTPEKAAEAWNKRADSPVRRGHWVATGFMDDSGRREYACSECKSPVYVFDSKLPMFMVHEPYCAGCGADMRAPNY